MTALEINVNENISASESISARSESDYLIISNKKKCRQILSKTDLSEEDLIDFYIALHVVLEVGLNTFSRHISLAGIQKTVDKMKIIKNLDDINFRDKTTLFIYNSMFDFRGNIADADKYHSIIGEMKSFSEIRNKLLHGHSISSLYEDGSARSSEARNSLTLERAQEQIKKFRFIMEGMRFYFDCLQSSWTPSGKENLKKEYLDDSFLTQCSPKPIS